PRAAAAGHAARRAHPLQRRLPREARRDPAERLPPAARRRDRQASRRGLRVTALARVDQAEVHAPAGVRGGRLHRPGRLAGGHRLAAARLPRARRRAALRRQGGQRLRHPHPANAIASKPSSTGAKAAKPAALPELPEGLRVTHPERVIDATTGLAKRDLVNWYLLAARRMLPHLAKRPVALVRAPSGVQDQLFF